MSGTSSLPLFPVVALIAGAASAQPRHPFAVSSMPTVVFTGDSQSCGRNLAIDFPQLVSRSLPVRVINTAVGGSNSSALLYPMKGGTVRVTRGEKVLHGENVRWGTGPFPGMKVTVAGETYTIDHIDEHPPTRNAELYLCGNYSGTQAGPVNRRASVAGGRGSPVWAGFPTFRLARK